MSSHDVASHSASRVQHVLILLLVPLLMVSTPAHVAGQAPPTGMLWVTYVNATPTTANLGDNLLIVFRVVYFTCEPYLGSISNPAVGIKTATFLIISIATQQSKEYPDVPVFPTGKEGEYRAEIQIAQDGPTGRVWVYVKGNSLQVAFEGGMRLGPPNNTHSELTYDTSDLSLIQIGQPTPPPSPSPLSQLLQGNELVLLLLAAVIILLLLISILARRKPKPPP